MIRASKLLDESNLLDESKFGICKLIEHLTELDT